MFKRNIRVSWLFIANKKATQFIVDCTSIIRSIFYMDVLSVTSKRLWWSSAILWSWSNCSVPATRTSTGLAQSLRWWIRQPAHVCTFTFLCFYSTYQNLLGFIFCLNKQYISLIASTAPAVWTGNISVRKWTICLFQAGQHWLVCWWHVWVANWRRSARPDLHLSAGSTVPWNPTRWSILLRF